MNIITDHRHTMLIIPIDLVTGDGPYAGLAADLRAAGLLMHHGRASNQHMLSALHAPESQWSEALRRWLVDRRPESLMASMAPRD